jgi:homoserine kinase
MTTNVTVRVPGSTANLGSGFDCIGLAVDRWFRATVRRDDALREPVRITRGGALAGLDIPPHKDLLYLGFQRACEAAGRETPRGIAMEASSELPIARGLGSSAAAVVAGAVAARALYDLPLDDLALVTLCAHIEGHADNVVASVSGGAVLVLRTPSGPWLYTPIEVHRSLALIFAVPDFMVSTERARAVLPPSVPHATAVVAVARSAALVQGLTSGDHALLEAGIEDVLHVPHRRSLVRGYDEVTAAARAAGAVGATLSGSGPTLVALGPVERAAAIETAMAAAWSAGGVTAQTFRMTRPVGRYEVR